MVKKKFKKKFINYIFYFYKINTKKDQKWLEFNESTLDLINKKND